MSNIAVLYDSCVLYSAPLRDLLMRLALTDLYRAKWTNEIHDEWIRNLLLNRKDLKSEFLERTRDMMNMHVRDCLVEDYQYLMPSIILPDPDDRHVLAAAIHSGCSMIVTYNLKDFPKESLGHHGIEAQHPDEFLMYMLELAPSIVLTTVKKHRECLKNPPKSVKEYLDILKAQSLLRSVNELNKFKETL
jgi:predicted nucleic acid-binding protein